MTIEAIGDIANVTLSEDTFDPSQVNGLDVWLDATEISGLNDGDTVSTWTNQAGTNDAQQNTGSPTYRESAINGKPAIEISDNNFQLDSRLNYTHDGSPFTIFIVYKVDSSVSGSYYSLWGSNDVTSSEVGQGLALDFRSADEESHNIITDGNGFVIDARNISGSYPDWQSVHVVTNRHDTSFAANWEFYSNGTQTQSVDESDSYNTGDAVRPPLFPPLNVDGFVGHLCELAVYNRSVTDSEQDDLESYFADKWGFTL